MTRQGRDRRPGDEAGRWSRRRVSSFVEALLAQRRPKPFAPCEDEAAQLRAAIELRALRPEAAAPSEEFVAALHRRLRSELTDESEADESAADESAADDSTADESAAAEPVPADAATSTGEGPDPRGSTGRRGVLQGAAVAAAAAVVSVAVDRAALRGEFEDRPALRPAPSGASAADGPGPMLIPAPGAWHGVMASADLAEGLVRGFDAGAVSGFVQRVSGRVRAVSGTCTHLGCRLALDVAAARLDCPCHLTSFALDGQLVRHQLPTPPPPLPRLAVKEADGQILVYLPTPVTQVTVH